MSKRIEYIASGCNFMQLAGDKCQQPKHLEYIRGCFQYIQDNTQHRFGLLFNGLVEASFGGALINYKPAVHSIHVDSGGLQVVTLGKQVTPELKDGVYRIQAKYGDLGMSFDEIPVQIIGKKSSRLDTSNRIFRRDKLEDFARLSGKNIARQIEVFLEEKSLCRPILIAQGNCYDTYMLWVDYMLQEVPKDHHQYIGGVAMGAAALGTGFIEDVQRAFIFTQLPIKTTHLHILGVGAVRRLLPYLVFMTNGAYDGVTVSYDSTTHTSGIEQGRFYTAEWKSADVCRPKKIDPTSLFSESTKSEFGTIPKIYGECWAEMQEVADLSSVTERDFMLAMNHGLTKYLSIGGTAWDFDRMRIAFVSRSIKNFCAHVDNLLSSEEELLKYADKGDVLGYIKYLMTVRTKRDFDCWIRDAYPLAQADKKTKPIRDFGVLAW